MSLNLVWALIIVSIILLTISLFPQLMWATGSFNLNQDVARYVFLGLSMAGLLGLWLLVKSTPKLSQSSDAPLQSPLQKPQVQVPYEYKVLNQPSATPSNPPDLSPPPALVPPLSSSQDQYQRLPIDSSNQPMDPSKLPKPLPQVPNIPPS